jgi:hypothetical protein
LNGAGRDPDIGGYVLVLPEPVGRSDDLESAEVLAVGGVSDEWPGGHPWPPSSTDMTAGLSRADETSLLRWTV